MDCILNKKPCNYCVYSASSYGPGPANISACLDCVAARDNSYRGACNTCAQSGANAARCFMCLSTYPFKFCPDNSGYQV